jgi:hypothetical protein
MVVVRAISLVFVASALMVLGHDLLFWLETEAFQPYTFIALWHVINAGSASAVQAWANGLPDFVGGSMNALLGAWAFVILGIPGVVLAIVAARR